ncbi:MAG: acyltransferase family protein [Hyphomicrobiales bacterium]|nr:acyltransferase family protein [Hyphomicrobiales bacterium]
MNAQRRLIHPDLLRIAAIVAVIGVHSSSSGVVRHGQIDIDQWWIANFLDSACRWAMPTFIVLSGQLTLGGKGLGGIPAYYAARVRRLVVPLVTWATLYFLWYAAFQKQVVDVQFVRQWVAEGLTRNHLYFLVVLTGLTVVAPALVWVRRLVGDGGMAVGGAAILAAASSGWIYRYVDMQALTLFIPYVGYFVLGPVLARGRAGPVLAGISGTAFVAATAWIAIGTGMRVGELGIDDYRSLSLYDYFSIPVLIQVVAIYYLFANIGENIQKKCVRDAVSILASATFGIYLVHLMILDFLRQLTFSWFKTNSGGATVFEVAVVFTASLAIALVLCRTPYLRAVVGERAPASGGSRANDR